MKTLAEFSQYVEAQTKLSNVRAQLSELRRDREQIVSQLHAAKKNCVESQAQALLNDTWVNTEALGAQLSEIDLAIHIHERAVEIAEYEAHRQLSFASAEICQEARKDFLPPVRQIMQALKQIDAANKTLVKLRNDLEREGVETGHIAYANFDIGEWNNGKIAGYRDYIERNFPELSSIVKNVA